MNSSTTTSCTSLFGQEVTRRRLAVERRKTQGVDGEMGRKAEDLQMIIMQRDGVIQMLKLQIEQFEEREVSGDGGWGGVGEWVDR